MKSYVVEEWLTFYPLPPLFLPANLPHGQVGIQLQVDHIGKAASRGRSGKVSSLYTMEKWWRIWPLTLMTDWDHFPLFPIKTVMTEQNLQTWSLDTSSPSPLTASFPGQSIFSFSWHLFLKLLASEPRQAANLGSVICSARKKHAPRKHCSFSLGPKLRGHMEKTRTQLARNQV